MKLEKERIEIVGYGRKMVDTGLVRGTGGNISCYDPLEKIMAISPGSLDYRETEPEDIVLLDLDGAVIEGERKPSSEWQMHAIFYRNRPDARSVVHTHSLNATALSCFGIDLPPIYYLTMIAGKSVRCAPYARFGTAQIAEAAIAAMEEGYAALLANHGVITCSYSLSHAYAIAEQVEYAAELYLKCKAIGEPTRLTHEQIDEMVAVFKRFRYEATGVKAD